jgi:hypothetical protein
MDPIFLIIVPGLVGGLVIALVVMRANRRSRRDVVAGPVERFDPPTDVVNMSRIRVAGIGGLGLVAMALVVALTVPRIGETLAWGVGLGVLLAVVLVLRGRRRGPLPSSGMRAGANTVLSIDASERHDDEAPRDSRDLLRHRVRHA